MLTNNSFNGCLYHITRYEKLKVGQKLHFGGQLNRYAQNMNQLSFEKGDKDANQLIFSKKLKDFSDDEEKMLRSYVYESCLIIRELVLENIRQKEFPDLPSRMECLYCTESLEGAREWASILLRMSRKNPPLQIVKLKAKGKLFRGDGNLILRNTKSLNSKIEMARQYWSQSSQSQNEELLFIGDIEVVDIIDNFN